MMLSKRIFALITLGILFAMTGCATVQKDAEEQSEYKVGYRRYKWHDGERQRKVWVDVWYPAKDESEERPLVYGLGQGSVAFKSRATDTYRGCSISASMIVDTFKGEKVITKLPSRPQNRTLGSPAQASPVLPEPRRFFCFSSSSLSAPQLSLRL